MLQWLKHAFAVEPPGPAAPSEAEAELADRLARAVVRRGLQTPAILALECSRNLNFVASQSLVFFAPIAQVIFNAEQYATAVGFLERRGSVEYLCRRIEYFVEAGPDAPAAPAAASAGGTVSETSS